MSVKHPTASPDRATADRHRDRPGGWAMDSDVREEFSLTTSTRRGTVSLRIPVLERLGAAHGVAYGHIGGGVG